MSGYNNVCIVQVNFVYDTLFIEQLYNKTLPEWTKKVFPTKMDPIRNMAFTLTTWNRELKRLRCGPILDSLVQVKEDAFNPGLALTLILHCFERLPLTISQKI